MRYWTWNRINWPGDADGDVRAVANGAIPAIISGLLTLLVKNFVKAPKYKLKSCLVPTAKT